MKSLLSVLSLTLFLLTENGHTQTLSDVLTSKDRQPSVIAKPKLIEQHLNTQMPGFAPAFVGKTALFSATQGDKTWWMEWGAEWYATTSLMARSASIQIILETDYGVDVPFNVGRAGLPDRNEVREGADIGKPVEESKMYPWCEALTPKDLAAGLAAATSYVAPELTFPNEKPFAVKEKAKFLIQRVLRSLETYCSPSDGGKMVGAYKKFLTEYSGVIEPVYRRKFEEVKQEKLKVQAAEEEEAKKVLAAKLILEREFEEKNKQEELLKLNRISTENALRAAQAEESERRRKIAVTQAEEHRQSIKSGRIPAETLKDLIILHDAKEGLNIVFYPPVQGDKSVYVISGKLVRRVGNRLIFEVSSQQDIRYFAVDILGNALQESGFNLRFEYPTRIVGRFESTVDYPTITGSQRQMPVFRGLGIGPN